MKNQHPYFNQGPICETFVEHFRNNPNDPALLNTIRVGRAIDVPSVRFISPIIEQKASQIRIYRDSFRRGTIQSNRKRYNRGTI
jgi:hypothetical protein